MTTAYRPLCNILLLSLLALLSAPATAVYKCEAGGKISYSDAPCPSGGKATKLEEPMNKSPLTSDITDAKRRAAREAAELKHIEKEKREREAKEEKSRQKLAKATADKRKECEELALQKKWAAEDAAAAIGKSVDKTKRHANRMAEKYDMQCGR